MSMRLFSSMGLSKVFKRRSVIVEKHASTIQSIPDELLQEILVKVASASFTDLYKAKLSCKDFLKVAEEDFIYQHVSIDDFPLVSWQQNQKSEWFLERCTKSGNAEALYRKGMKEYFNSSELESGLESLKRSAQKHHKEAMYVYGIILIMCFKGKPRQHGFDILSYLKSSKCLVTSRRKVEKVLRNMWIYNHMDQDIEPLGHSKICSNVNGGEVKRIEKRGGWQSMMDDDDEEEFDDGTCEFCRWKKELDIFRSML